MKYVSLTNKGNFYKHNEDAYIILEQLISYERMVMMAIADGIGGLAFGDIASDIAIQKLKRLFKEMKEEVDDARILACIYEIDQKIREKGRKLHKRMGTTLSVVICFKGILHMYHVGDGKVLLARDSIYQVSEDHTVAQRKIKRNQLPNLQEHSQLYQCLGVGKLAKVQIRKMNLQDGDVIMVASDGLFHKIRIEEVWAYIRSMTLEVVGDALISLARNRNEKDNLTCLLLEYY